MLQPYGRAIDKKFLEHACRRPARKEGKTRFLMDHTVTISLRKADAAKSSRNNAAAYLESSLSYVVESGW